MTETILKILNSETSMEEPIKSKTIENRTGLRGFELREIIHELRLSGHPIGSTSDGYFIAKSKWELDHTIAQLKSRGSKIFEVADALENCFDEQTQMELL